MSKIYRVVLRTVMFVRADNKEDARTQVYEGDFIGSDTQIDSIILSNKSQLNKELYYIPNSTEIFDED